MARDTLRTGPLRLTEGAPEDALEDADRVFSDGGPLGVGGTSEVRAVFDPRLLRHAAMKRIRPDAVHPRVLARFVEEARIHGQLQHPNLVPVHEFGADAEGGLYLNMQRVSGQTLTRFIDDQGTGRLDKEVLAKVIPWLMRVCDALAFAHDQGVYHCDVKPENILVADRGQVYLLDWGIAELSDQSTVITNRSTGPEHPYGSHGTPAFMSPEQARGESVGAATDVFGVGACLYYALTGRPLYVGMPLAEMLYQAASARIPAADEVGGARVPTALARITQRALSRRPEDRYPTIADLRRALEQFLRGTWRLPVQTYAKGSLIVREGTRGRHAWVILRGRCLAFSELEGQRLELREMGPGDVFGELALLSNRARSASVEALTEVELVQVPRGALAEGLGLNTWLGSFVRSLADQFHEVDAKLREAMSTPPESDL